MIRNESTVILENRKYDPNKLLRNMTESHKMVFALLSFFSIVRGKSIVIMNDDGS